MQNKQIPDGKERNILTPAAEDCLEMIFKLSAGDGGEDVPVRICALAEQLGVSPSSASRMAQAMALWGYIDFRRYGYITLTELGREVGGFFCTRHETVEEFFRELCGGSCTDDTTRLAHFISADTVAAMAEYLRGKDEKNADHDAEDDMREENGSSVSAE